MHKHSRFKTPLSGSSIPKLTAENMYKHTHVHTYTYTHLYIHWPGIHSLTYTTCDRYVFLLFPTSVCYGITALTLSEQASERTSREFFGVFFIIIVTVVGCDDGGGSGGCCCGESFALCKDVGYPTQSCKNLKKKIEKYKSDESRTANEPE